MKSTQPPQAIVHGVDLTNGSVAPRGARMLGLSSARHWPIGVTLAAVFAGGLFSTSSSSTAVLAGTTAPVSATAVSATAVSATAAAPDEPYPLLPDLFPWVSESRGYLYDWVVEGDLLRFTTAFANQGEGHLELRGGQVLPSGNQQVFQRIFYSDGTFTDRLAGEFTYHQGHGHIHFDGYAVYSLREYLPGGGVGEIVASGGKISFCLIDITKYNPTAGASRYNSCGQIQGVTAGWSDVYGRYLPDQWINISLVPDGEYWLEIVIDPDNLLLESNLDNNVARIPVVLDRGGPTGGDRWEPNNSFAQATNFGRTGKFHEVGLSLHNASDEDHFKLVADLHGEFDVHLNFTHQLGNLDLFIYDGQQNLIASSTSLTDNEEIHFHGHEDETYYIVVRGVDGATNGYELDVHGPGDLVTMLSKNSDGPHSIPDGAGSSTPGPWAVSTVVGPEVLLTDLNLIFERLDHTWLGDLEVQLTSPQGTTVTILTSQWQSGGGLLGSQDNFLNTRLDDQAALNLSQGTAPYTGWYRINHANTGTAPLAAFIGENAAGVWTIRVRDWFSADTGTLHSWSLMFTGVNLNPGDRFEPNDAHPQAVDLGAVGVVTVEEVSIHNAVDRDFYRFIAGVSGVATVETFFSHADGNLDMIVYDSALLEVGRADSLTDHERLDFFATAEELYYIEVFGVQGARNDYSVRVDIAQQIGETGTISGITDAWTTVQLEGQYQNPVLQIGPATLVDPQPGLIELRHIESARFEVRIANWHPAAAPRSGETLDYWVIEQGFHELPGGQWIEAGVTDRVNQFPQRIRLTRPTTRLVPTSVFSQVVSQNRNRTGLARVIGLGTSDFNLVVQEAESSQGLVAPQTVHWIAVGGQGDAESHFKYETGAARVTSRPSTLSFGQGGSEMPRFFAALQSLNESDPAVLRLLDLKSGKATLFLQEEQTWDKETQHDTERVVWLKSHGRKIFVAGRSPN